MSANDETPSTNSSKHHGRCKTCGTDLATMDDASEHMSATSTPVSNPNVPGVTTRSHVVTVLNPPREAVVRRLIGADISAAADEFAEKLARQVESGEYTKTEAKEAPAGYPDFAEAWACIENDVDERQP